MKRIAIVVSSPATVKSFLMDQIEALSRIYRVSVVLNLTENDNPLCIDSKVEVVAIPIVRNISVLRDLYGFVLLVSLFTRRRFDAVHSITPKAGLLAALAGTIAGIPVRIHTFTGQAWVTRSGLAKLVLKALDKLMACLMTNVLVDSPSQCDFLVREGILPETKASVLANGSICGVDTGRFRPDSEWRRKIRQLQGIPGDDVVFLYVGRLRVEKGVLDLAQAFSRLGENRSQAWLLFVGPDEERLQPRIEMESFAVSDRLRFIGAVDSPQEYMAAADVLCLPSYREGFGTVIIEAASVGIPAIASHIYGITDAIEPGVTGLLNAPGDVDSLQSTMQTMIDDAGFREFLGREARLRANRLFSRDLVTSALIRFYKTVVA